MEEVVSIKCEPEWASENEEEGSSSFETAHELVTEDEMASPPESEKNLTPITEVIIKEEPWDPTLDNPHTITKKEENDMEADINSKGSEDSQDRNREVQASCFRALIHAKYSLSILLLSFIHGVRSPDLLLSWNMLVFII
ncbi:uncharacterized protein [Anabrus simplex]|uniref:uncharacterized protein isoform X2 n=1 Tax=Anabrus simplex TaxID=316456 RepID=UPI0035A3BAF5